MPTTTLPITTLPLSLFALVLALGLVGCGGSGGSDGGTTPPPPTVTISAHSLTTYGTCTTPGDLTTYTARAAVSDEVLFTPAEAVYIAAAFAPGVSITETPRATFAFYLDPVGGTPAATPLETTGTLRFYTVGGARMIKYILLGTTLAAGGYRVRVVVTPADGFPAGTAAQTVTMPYTVTVAPSGAG